MDRMHHFNVPGSGKCVLLALLMTSKQVFRQGVIVDTNFVSELARKLSRAVPDVGGDVDVLREDLERNFRGLLSGAFERIELVTREEFDVQRRVLERTRERLAALEAQVAALEQQHLRPDSKRD